MKVKNFILGIFIITIVQLLVTNIIKFKNTDVGINNAVKIDYDMKISQSEDNMNIIHDSNELLDIDLLINTSEHITLTLMLFINDEQIEFQTEEVSGIKHTATYKKGENKIPIRINGEDIKNKKEKLSITLYQDINKTQNNDFLSYDYMILNNSYDTLRSINFDNAILTEFSKIKSNNNTLIINDDLNLYNEYSLFNYILDEKFIYSENNSIDISIRTQSLKENNDYLIYFTINGMQINIEENKKYIYFKAEEDSNYFTRLNLDVSQYNSGDIILCNIVKNPMLEVSYSGNLISNKLTLKK